MRISDWSSDVCSSDLRDVRDVARDGGNLFVAQALVGGHDADAAANGRADLVFRRLQRVEARADRAGGAGISQGVADAAGRRGLGRELMKAKLAITLGKTYRQERSEEHTSELQSLMRISYAVFCLKKKKQSQ